MSGPMRTAPGHFARWAKARALVARIQKHLSAGGTVIVATYTRATQYDARHIGTFRASPSGALVRRGKSWDCIDFTPVLFR